MTKAILVTILCCLPFGIYAIVKAAGVNGAWERGEYEEAHRLSGQANSAADWAFGIGLVLGLIRLLSLVAGDGY